VVKGKRKKKIVESTYEARDQGLRPSFVTSDDSIELDEHSPETFSSQEDPVELQSELSSSEDLLPYVVESIPKEESAQAYEIEVEPKGVRKDIVPYDPLQAYLREMRRHKSLTKEQENELALRYFHHKDKEAAYRLVVSNLWLVVKIARDYEDAARNLLDLIQEGNIGLLEAIKNFDPYREVRFPSYAAWWIKAYIIRFIIANWRLVKIGTTQAQRKLFFNLKKEKDKLEREGFYPGPRLIAQNLNVREQDVVEMEQRLAGADMSVDAPLGGESDQTLLSLLPGDAQSSEALLSEKERKQLIETSLQSFRETLNPKEKIIFDQRLLGESEEKATLQDLSEATKVSRERIRQIETRIKEKLKAYLLKNFSSSLDDMMGQ
jgi:RNA polymerase sigma-32 factor